MFLRACASAPGIPSNLRGFFLGPFLEPLEHPSGPAVPVFSFFFFGFKVNQPKKDDRFFFLPHDHWASAALSGKHHVVQGRSMIFSWAATPTATHKHQHIARNGQSRSDSSLNHTPGLTRTSGTFLEPYTWPSWNLSLARP